ncbi:hypothetical protein [Sphingomonas sp. PWP1-2]|uniref:hypothetical protein n=1 Tax=Sphingomonas sp. PWP1-2 TaxID=2804558 RepID=UPI003CEBF523
MTYTVVWLKGETVLATTNFDDLSPAKRHAKEHFPIQKNRRGATAVEVRDDQGVRHFLHGDER